MQSLNYMTIRPLKDKIILVEKNISWINRIGLDNISDQDVDKLKKYAESGDKNNLSLLSFIPLISEKNENNLEISNIYKINLNILKAISIKLRGLKNGLDELLLLKPEKLSDYNINDITVEYDYYFVMKKIIESIGLDVQMDMNMDMGIGIEYQNHLGLKNTNKYILGYSFKNIFISKIIDSKTVIPNLIKLNNLTSKWEFVNPSNVNKSLGDYECAILLMGLLNRKMLLDIDTTTPETENFVLINRTANCKEINNYDCKFKIYLVFEPTKKYNLDINNNCDIYLKKYIAEVNRKIKEIEELEEKYNIYIEKLNNRNKYIKNMFEDIRKKEVEELIITKSKLTDSIELLRDMDL